MYRVQNNFLCITYLPKLDKKENSHENIAWSEMGKQNLQAKKVNCFYKLKQLQVTPISYEFTSTMVIVKNILRPTTDSWLSVDWWSTCSRFSLVFRLPTVGNLLVACRLSVGRQSVDMSCFSQLPAHYSRWIFNQSEFVKYPSCFNSEMCWFWIMLEKLFGNEAHELLGMYLEIFGY